MKLLTAVSAVLLSTSIFAIDVQYNRFTQNLRYESLENAILENPYTGKRDRWGFAAGYSYVEDPLGRGERDTTLAPIISRLHAVQFGLNFALSKNWEIIGMSSFSQAREDATNEESTTIGDTTLALKYRFLNKEKWSMAMKPFVVLPTGDRDIFLGNDSTGFGATLAVEKQFSFFDAVLNLGYQKTKDNIFRNIDYSDLYNIGIGARIPLGRFVVQAEYRVSFTNDSDEQRPNEFHLGGSFALTDYLRLFSSLGLGEIEFKNNNDFRFLAGIKGSFGKKEKVIVPVPVPAPAPVKKPKKVIRVVQRELNLARKVHYYTNSHKIKNSSLKLLDYAAEVILKYQDQIKSIEIEGHTDSRGSANYNRQLSQRRADSVRDYLISKGVDGNLLSSQGYGEDRLLVNPERSTIDFAKNRRVEFVVQGIITEEREIAEEMTEE